MLMCHLFNALKRQLIKSLNCSDANSDSCADLHLIIETVSKSLFFKNRSLLERLWSWSQDLNMLILWGKKLHCGDLVFWKQNLLERKCHIKDGHYVVFTFFWFSLV